MIYLVPWDLLKLACFPLPMCVLLRDNIYFLFFRILCILPGIYPNFEVPIVTLPTINIKNCHCVHLSSRYNFFKRIKRIKKLNCDKPIQHRFKVELGGALFFKENTHGYGSGINFQWWFKEWSLSWNCGSWNQRTYPELLAFFRSSHEIHSFFEIFKNPKQEVLTNPRTTQYWLKLVLAGYCFFP